MCKKLYFKSFLGEWTEALIELFFIAKEDIEKWEFDFEKIKEDGCPDLDKNGKIKETKDKQSENNLYIYVAPITWASRYQNNGFKVLGPAFGTNDALSIYAGTYDYIKSDAKSIKVGTVGKYITSTALFLVYQLFMEYIFNTNIHLLSRDGEIKYKNIKNIEFFFDNIQNKTLRYNKLRSKTTDYIDYAVFTFRDLIELELKDKDDVREILKIDPLLSHIFNIHYVPRTVYCIHESQLNQKEQLCKFYELIGSKTQKFGEPLSIEIENKGTKIKTTVFPIDPDHKKARTVLNLIIGYFKKMLENISESEDEKNIINLFEEINWINFGDIVENFYK